MKSVDLTREKVVSARDVEAAVRGGASELLVGPQALLTTTARAALARHGCALRRSAAPSDAASSEVGCAAAEQAARAEIVAVGGKLWQRQYVDGNGGNISCRIDAERVLCTPTLVSKIDLSPADLCVVDLEGRQLSGTRACTSEILMHLEIYRHVAQARAVVHCHPPHATAYAITGRVPPPAVIPEYEVLVGRVALTRYETPGTRAFAESVLPYVREHSTLLLANHGVVAWADTVTHAEWCCEIVDTYCWTLMLAGQLGVPITRIPPEKLADLLAVRRRLGLPVAAAPSQLPARGRKARSRPRGVPGRVGRSTPRRPR